MKHRSCVSLRRVAGELGGTSRYTDTHLPPPPRERETGREGESGRKGERKRSDLFTSVSDDTDMPFVSCQKCSKRIMHLGSAEIGFVLVTVVT